MPRPEELERQIQAVSDERQALAEEVHQVCSDLAHARDEDHRKLIELESLGTRFETTREADSSTIHGLERRLAELESERDQARDQARSLEASLTEATHRLERTDHQVKELQAGYVEQARRFQDSLAEASRYREDRDRHDRELDERLDSERQDYLNAIQGLTSRFRKQDVRMSWTMSVAGAALLLGTVAGIILLWEMQRNTTLLSSMSRDIKELMASVNGGLGLQDKPPEEQQQALAPPVIPPPIAGTTVAAPPEKSTAPKPRTAEAPTRATVTRPGSNPYFLGSALNRGPRRASEIRSLVTKLEGNRGSVPDDASSFFEANARVDGVVSLPSGVQYRVVKAGSGKSPKLSDRIVVAYVGTMLDGTIFDETYSTGLSSTFRMRELSPGWREVLLKMEEGAEFELYIPAGLTTSGGVRKRGAPGQEPHIYLIELIEVVKERATAQAVPAK